MSVLRNFQLCMISVFAGFTMCLVNSILTDNNKKKKIYIQTESVLISIFASLLSGLSNDLIGRGHTLIIANLIWLVGLMFKSKKILLVGNALVCVTIPLLVSQLAPPKWKGAIITLYQFAIPFGDLLDYIITAKLGKVSHYFIISFAVLQLAIVLCMARPTEVRLLFNVIALYRNL